ncbi:MAG: cell division protein FtsQ [Halobacteriovoraceae bacterium]|nr:cell division protein FtsQ [Halobacteriovoraceae bacterium]
MKYLLIFLCLIQLQANEPKEKLKYRTSFGQCPSKVAGALTLQLVKEFENNRSLLDVKKKIIDDNLVEKHFLSQYEINFNPVKKELFFNLECPSPLMKVQIYKDGGLDSYEAILVDSGELFDPTYEVLLRSEHKIKHDLPSLALPVGDFGEETQKQVTDLFSDMSPRFRQKLSEMIISDKKDLTVILSINGNPSSVFLGQGDWRHKFKKLDKIVTYMEQKNKVPAIINLTNSKKVVVKFNESL